MTTVFKNPGRFAMALALFLLLFGVGHMCALAEEASDSMTILSTNMPYTYAGKQPHDNYPDDGGKQLTDGQLGGTDFFNDRNWVSFWHNGSFSVTIDLQETQSIAGVRTHHLAGTGGIRWPKKLSVQLSTDGETWVEAHTLDVTEPTPGASTIRWFDMAFVEAASGRYARVTYWAEGHHVHLSEIEVYSR